MVARHRTKDHPLRVEAAFHQSLAMRLRTRGYTYQEIAEKIGVANPQVAYNLVMRGVRSVRLDSAEQMRDIELGRYDELTKIAWRAIEAADKRRDFKSIASILNSITRLSDRRAKLMGLDAPVKYDLLMNEARQMAESLNMPHQEFMALCEKTAGEAWGK